MAKKPDTQKQEIVLKYPIRQYVWLMLLVTPMVILSSGLFLFFGPNMRFVGAFTMGGIAQGILLIVSAIVFEGELRKIVSKGILSGVFFAISICLLVLLIDGQGELFGVFAGVGMESFIYWKVLILAANTQ